LFTKKKEFRDTALSISWSIRITASIYIISQNNDFIPSAAPKRNSCNFYLLINLSTNDPHTYKYIHTFDVNLNNKRFGDEAKIAQRGNANHQKGQHSRAPCVLFSNPQEFPRVPGLMCPTNRKELLQAATLPKHTHDACNGNEQTYRCVPPLLLEEDEDAMRARGSPRIATSPPMKDEPAATAKAGAFPPPNI